MSTYSSTWEEHTVEILDYMKYLLQTTDVFPKENIKILGAFNQWPARMESYPNCSIRLSRDRVGFANADEEQHTFTVEVLASMKGTTQDVYDWEGVEADNKSFLRMVGEIDEVFRTHNTLDGRVNWLLIRDKDLVYGFEEEGFLFYEALLVCEMVYVF